MAQLIARVDENLVSKIDQLIQLGIVSNRSEAIRIGLEELVDKYERRRIGQSIVQAYRCSPQVDEELSGLYEATKAMIEEESW